MASEPFAQIQLTAAIRQGLRCKSGVEFQSAAQEILRHQLPEFVPIIPHGRDGDGGNDGYSKRLGIYTQIYAPDAARLPGPEAARKAVADFTKIKRRWHTTTPVKEYWFVTNAPGSNIHVERALRDIKKRHGVKTRFVGTAELTEHVASLPRRRIEQLMGFTVRGGGFHVPRTGALDLLASVTTSQLVGLHQLAAIVHPIPPALCEQLLRKVTNWKAIWPWLRHRGWVKKDSNLIELDERVMEQCRKNVAEQRRACERWIDPLLTYGSSDCLYLAVLPLLTLGRKAEAVRVIARAGWECTDSEWAGVILEMLELLDKPAFMASSTPSARLALRLARANLLSRAGRHEESVTAYEQCLRVASAWPRRTSRGVAMLNCGVSAHLSGQVQLARSRYEEAIVWARRRHDDWTLGRAATNLAQLLDESDLDKAGALIAEAEAAKRRFGDTEGLVGIAMAKGLLAVHQSEPVPAHQHFAEAGRLANRHGVRDALADVYFNLGKTSGEMGNWRLAAREYRRSLAEATKRADLYREARARVGLAQSLFILGDWDGCGSESQALAGLPAEPRWSSMRLTGLHGIVALQLRTNGRAASRSIGRALAFARRSGDEEWVGRLLTDSVLGRHTTATPRELRALLDSGVAEAKAGRLEAAAHVYREVWYLSVRSDATYAAIERRAESLLDRTLARRHLRPVFAIECFKWKYAACLHVGQPWKALDALQRCTKRASEVKMWEEYARAVDQQAVTLAELGRTDVAEPLHREALRCATRHHLRGPARISSSNLAECLRQRGRVAAAYRASRRALSLHVCEEDPAAYVSVLHNHYLIERDAGRRSALRTLERCETLARRYSLEQETIRAVMARANDAWNRGDRRRAIACFRRAIRLGDINTDSSITADARYNLALILREEGRPNEALHILGAVDKSSPTSMQRMHQASLNALLFEDTGSLTESAKAWSEAANVAGALEEYEHQAYCVTRAKLLTGNCGTSSHSSHAQQAERLLKAIYRSRGSKLQARYDATIAFCDKNALTQYHIHAHRAIAVRLAATARENNYVVAAQASVASLIVACQDPVCAQWAMEMHVQWLMRLPISRSKLKWLRSRIHAWLTDILRPSDHPSLISPLLAGFDAALKPRP